MPNVRQAFRELVDACYQKGHVPEPGDREWPSRCRDGGCVICATLKKYGVGSLPILSSYKDPDDDP